MKVAITGGGPGGLYAAILFSRLDAANEVTVWERNAPDDTFGFGVVFSDETLTAFEAADPPTYARDHATASPAGRTSTSTTAAPSSAPAATASRRSAGATC